MILQKPLTIGNMIQKINNLHINFHLSKKILLLNNSTYIFPKSVGVIFIQPRDNTFSTEVISYG